MSTIATDPSKRAFETAGGVTRHDTRELRPGEERLISGYFSGRVLDIGCGTGRMTGYIAKTCEVIGIDYAAAMIARAKEHYPQLDFHVMDVRSLEFPDGSFDAAFFSFNGIDNLYPLEERLKALREIKRVLRPGGIFAYVSHADGIPAPNNLKRILGHAYSLLHGYRAPYFAHFTGYGFVVNAHFAPTLQRQQLKDAGFEIIEDFSVKQNVEMMYITRRV